MNPRSMRPMNHPRIVPAVVAATAADAASPTPIAVLEELLTHSIRLRDLYKNARRQIPSGQFGGLRRILDDRYKEQVRLIDVIVDRIRVLGGAVGVFASEFLQSAPSCRLLPDTLYGDGIDIEGDFDTPAGTRGSSGTIV